MIVGRTCCPLPLPSGSLGADVSALPIHCAEKTAVIEAFGQGAAMGGRSRKNRRMLVTAAAALFPGAAFAVGSVVNYVAGVVQITFITAGAACSSLAAYVALRSKAKLADAEIAAFSENLCAIVENLVRLAHEPNGTSELKVQT